MRINFGFPIPDLSSLPGPSRPGQPIPGGGDTYGFKFAVSEAPGAGRVAMQVNRQNTGSFTVKWQNGVEQVVNSSSTITSPTANAGTISINKSTDDDFCSTFKITTEQALVTSVVQWGENIWNTLTDGFKDCVNLTSFPSTGFTGISTGVNLTSCFQDCTSLTALDLSSWNLTGGSTMSLFSEGCINAESFNLPALTPRKGSWSNAFQNVGTSVAAGCAFNFEGLNFTGSTDTSFSAAMKGTKIAPSSSFKDWNFTGLSNNSLTQFFEEAEITGNNSTLDISGWTTFTGSLQRFFYSFNNPGGSRSSFTGTKLNVTNLNTTLVSDLYRFAGLSNFYSIIGLSTWQANTISSISIRDFFYNSINLAITVADNLSDAFMNSLKPTLISFAFRGIGTNLASSEWGTVPNLGSIDLEDAAAGSFLQLFDSSRFSSGNIDFTNIKLPTATQDFYRFASQTYFSNSDSYILFPTAGVGGSVLSTSRFYESFNDTKVRKITIGNSVNFSTNTSAQAFRGTFQNASGDPSTATINTEITLPTIMNFGGVPTSSNQSFLSMFNGTRGVDSIGSTKVAISSCQVNNLLRRLEATLPTPGADVDIVLDNCKYSGPQALVSDDYATLSANGWLFGTLASEAPYFTLNSYSIGTGSTTQATINAAYTGGTFTSSNTSVATVNASTGLVTGGSDIGTCQIIYTLSDGICYNEVDLTTTIPLVANNFSFNFDGINDFMAVRSNSSLDTSLNASPVSTVAAWVFKTTANAYGAIYVNGRANSGYFGMNLMINNANKLEARFNMANNSKISSASIPINEWVHVAVTYNNVVSNGISLYINGVGQSFTPSFSTALRYTSLTPAFTITTAVTIGQVPNSGSPFWNWPGKIDEVAVWDSVLTGPQILDLYNGRLGVTNETVDLSKYPTLGGNLIYWNRMGD